MFLRTWPSPLLHPTNSARRGGITLSLLQDASSLPSGDHATHHTRSVWPSSTAVSVRREEDMVTVAGCAYHQPPVSEQAGARPHQSVSGRSEEGSNVDVDPCCGPKALLLCALACFYWCGVPSLYEVFPGICCRRSLPTAGLPDGCNSVWGKGSQRACAGEDYRQS